MSTTSRVARRLATTSIAALVALTITAGPALAQDIVTVDPSGTTIAADPGPRAAASIPRGIVVTDPGEQPVVLTAKGLPTLRKPRPGNAPAVFRDLKAGTSYTVWVGDKALSRVTVVDRPSAATRLVVSTASTPESVNLTWQHSATAPTGGKAISYDVAATPASGKAFSKTVKGSKAATLSGLDPHALYTFAVTPRNSAGKGRPTVAAMQRSLADITGLGTSEPAKTSPVPTPVTEPKAQPAPPIAAAPASAPAPAPAPTPSTKTIYVCPTGYTEVAGLCQVTQAYTFDVKAYTYHQDFVQTGTHVDYSTSPNGGTYYTWQQWCPNGGCSDGYYKVVTDGYYVTAKDATPVGYTDTGTNWTKKNPGPDGYLDDGTQWVKTVAKEARVVPA